MATFFLLFFGESKFFVAPPPAKNYGYALGFIHIYLRGGGGGGVQPWFLWVHNFEIWVGHDGQDMYQSFENSFESIGTTLPMWGLGAKMGPKNQILKPGDRA